MVIVAMYECCRRPLATRERLVHTASASLVENSSTHFRMRLSTQAGTYLAYTLQQLLGPFERRKKSLYFFSNIRDCLHYITYYTWQEDNTWFRWEKCKISTLLPSHTRCSYCCVTIVLSPCVIGSRWYYIRGFNFLSSVMAMQR